MADDFDPCECVFSPQMIMRRILNILRQTQQNCNDVECFPELPGTPNQDGAGDNFFMMMMVMWALFIVGMMVTRPNSLRNSPDNQGKPGPSNGGNSGSDGQDPPQAGPSVQ